MSINNIKGFTIQDFKKLYVLHRFMQIFKVPGCYQVGLKLY